MTHIATIGTATATTAVSSISITLTAGAAVGHTVTCAVGWESSAGTVPTVSAVTDSHGNTWTVTPDAAAGGNGNATVAAVLLHARVTTALQAGDTITVTVSSGTRTRWMAQVDDFDDVNTSPLDVTARNDNPGSSTALSTGTTGSTAQAYELTVGVLAFALPSARTVTIASGWSGGPQVATAAGSSNRAIQVIWRYTSTVGTKSGSITLDQASTYCGLIAAYKATSLAPPVGRVSQVKLQVPAPAIPAVAHVSQVKLQVPVGAVGVVRVAQAKLRVPRLPDQAPYSGIKYADNGALVDAALSAARNGTV